MNYPIAFLLSGYIFTVLIEGPILWLGLSRQHGTFERLFAAVWLTSCTYPVVVLVLPQVLSPGDSRVLYLVVAETFAPLAECFLFYQANAILDKENRSRDFLVIALANAFSFAIGELSWRLGWF